MLYATGLQPEDMSKAQVSLAHARAVVRELILLLPSSLGGS